MTLTLSWRRPLSYRKQSIDLLPKSMDWFLYDKGLRHERVKQFFTDESHLLYSTCNENYFWVSNTYILESCVFQNSDQKKLRQSKWLMTKGISKMKTSFWLPLSLNCFYKNPVFQKHKIFGQNHLGCLFWSQNHTKPKQKTRAVTRTLKPGDIIRWTLRPM